MGELRGWAGAPRVFGRGEAVPRIQARGGGGAAHHPRNWPLCDWGWREVGERGCPPASPPTRPPTFKYFQQQGRKVGCGRGPGRAGPPPILGGSTRCRKGGSLYCIVYPGPGRVSPRTQTWMGRRGAPDMATARLSPELGALWCPGGVCGTPSLADGDLSCSSHTIRGQPPAWVVSRAGKNGGPPTPASATIGAGRSQIVSGVRRTGMQQVRSPDLPAPRFPPRDGGLHPPHQSH